jgi:DNA repair exonuclease SbcCD ATPase subunit
MQSIFPTWEKAPEKLLEIKDRLADSAPGGWRPNRLILQNYWRFGYEEFHFAQGRLILRGANGSGKSTVLVSAITLVLDMEKRRERLDTFGGQGRGAAYYLIGEPEASSDSDFYHFERTGYVALEFTNPAGEFRTIGVGLYTTRNRPDRAVDAWGFIITDGRRVGIDFHLYDRAHLPLSARALRDALGAGGLLLERSAEYQTQVNAQLFGFDTPAEYDFLLSLLLQLRSPKLNKDTRPSDIRAMLTDSLPPLPSDLLNQAVQIIEDIDHCLEHLEETKEQHDSAVAIDDWQAAYLNQLAQREAVEYLNAEQQWRQARRAQGKAQEQLAQAQARLQTLQESLTHNNTAERQALGRLEVLENHEAFREQKTLETLNHDLRRAQQAAEGAQQSLGRR